MTVKVQGTEVKLAEVSMKILEVLDADSIGGWIRVSQAASLLTTGRTDSQTDFNMTW